MKAALIALGLLACHSAPAWSETEFQLHCPGRATMTVSRAEYGLTTVMWPDNHFQIAAGQQRTKLEAGDPVAITRFRNGDQLIVNQRSEEIFFVYRDSDKLLPCNRSEKRDVDALSLERYDDRQRSDS
ncbi:hypothetical protein HA42_08485 [Pantoea deleyi]|uniref:C-type lysozyme inhibitor domain-containing protein n=1 Tax=Pantoea deleyi TaxID=470932 RepID=A0A506QSY3_9GAMM|nr:hypothetical protein [Pantoea deleyi]ORM82388.1 hypothetical protein HA42_08485 [Pantoea deleyi]TPV47510.1 hypothetical protein FJW01_03790 [Pantoea deleyi]